MREFDIEPEHQITVLFDSLVTDGKGFAYLCSKDQQIYIELVRFIRHKLEPLWEEIRHDQRHFQRACLVFKEAIPQIGHVYFTYSDSLRQKCNALVTEKDQQYIQEKISELE